MSSNGEDISCGDKNDELSANGHCEAEKSVPESLEHRACDNTITCEKKAYAYISESIFAEAEYTCHIGVAGIEYIKQRIGYKLERKKSMREARVDITTRAVRQELDVRGMALDEAIPEVEKFIDDAMLSSLGEVSIIHGNGTGVLRAGIQDCLRRHPCVSSFRLGRYGEGETGVTIVSLK